ncbi:bifunctional DNA-formamidopyrimidine glycosylase/DNA-(apurinic or apyrimidinic site) lyase [bacterium]|nr:bifunctional DNA-formamidopyrimidine glycosylase/DNA-(apurinic or apyrimidinic site) lyase [bacterium]
MIPGNHPREQEAVIPELPEVETVKNGLSEVALGKVVGSVKFYRKDLREEIPVKLVKEILVGKKITEFSRRSKYILITTEKGTVLSHLGMTGAFLTRHSKKPEKEHTHFVIGLKNSKGECDLYLHYVDPRRFGRLSATKQNPYDHTYLNSLGPEPLELNPDELGDHLFKLSRKRTAPVKNFIMDAKIVVGVGNIYACESLFKAGVSPLKHSGKVTKRKFVELAKAIINTLKSAIKQGGTTIKDFQNADGGSGYFAVALQVYGRQGLPCPICKKPILQIKQAGRSSWYCKICQK